MSEISVIVPVYNVEEYLYKCIDSILAQTFKNFELILVDDGSPDNCPSICDEYAKKDERIKVIHQENQGLSGARNTGINIAKGKYITFVDSDDIINKFYLEILYKNITDEDCDISICDYYSFYKDTSDLLDDNVQQINLLTGKQASKEIYGLKNVKFVIACGKLYKSYLFNNYRFPIGKINEDEFLTYKLFYKSKRIVESSDKLYYYRRRGNSITNSIFSLKNYDAVLALEERMEFYKQKDEVELLELTKRKYELVISMYSIKARKSKIYHLVEKKYKKPLYKAIKYLNDNLSNDVFEYFLYDYYPMYVKLYAYHRKIKSLF